MSKFIRLETASRIREWMDQNPWQGAHLQAKTISELIASDTPITNKVPNGAWYYGVVHTLDLGEGWQSITLRRIFVAIDAEGALQQYVYGPQRHISGKGVECIDITLRDNFRHEPQSIDVFPLAEGTDCFY